MAEQNSQLGRQFQNRAHSKHRHVRPHPACGVEEKRQNNRGLGG